MANSFKQSELAPNDKNRCYGCERQCKIDAYCGVGVYPKIGYNIIRSYYDDQGQLHYITPNNLDPDAAIELGHQITKLCDYYQPTNDKNNDNTDPNKEPLKAGTCNGCDKRCALSVEWRENQHVGAAFYPVINGKAITHYTEYTEIKVAPNKTDRQLKTINAYSKDGKMWPLYLLQKEIFKLCKHHKKR